MKSSTRPYYLSLLEERVEAVDAIIESRCLNLTLQNGAKQITNDQQHSRDVHPHRTTTYTLIDQCHTEQFALAPIIRPRTHIRLVGNARLDGPAVVVRVQVADGKDVCVGDRVWVRGGGVVGGGRRGVAVGRACLR